MKILRKVKVADAIPSSEIAMAKKFKDKGYNYVAQITTIRGDFGDPMYFKSLRDIASFLQSFPDYENAKIKWSSNLDSV